LKIRLLADAEAVAYDDGLLSGLGSEFASEVRGGLRRIEEHPKAWPLLADHIRRYRLNRFPYGLVYMPLQSEIIVLAVMHLHR
jgi:toxin ParE2